MEKLTCIKCGQLKTKEEMTKRNNKAGYINKCRTCTNEYNKKVIIKRAFETDRDMYIYFGFKLRNIILQDKKRFPDHVNDLTVDDLIKIFENHDGRCIYSRTLLNPTGQTSIFKKPSFDRKDNTLPHIASNLQLTSVFMNMLRNNQTHEEFMEQCKDY